MAKILGIAVLVIALIGLGLFVAKGPQPEIIVPAEVITKVGFLNITNTMISAWLAMALLAFLTFLATRTMRLAPTGLQNFFEGIVSFLLAQMEDIAGEKKTRLFFPLVATIFLFVLVSNWMGLLPFFNAIGKTEDVGYHVFHELADEHPHDLKLKDGKYEEDEKFAGWKMSGAGGMVVTKSGAKAVDFEVKAGETPEQALDRYIVFLARNFADKDVTGFDVEEDVVENPTPEQVKAAVAALEKDPRAPKLLLAADHSDEKKGEGGEGEKDEPAAHGIKSEIAGGEVLGIDFDKSQKFALVVPYFRGVYSDVNNTLALGLIAFAMIEFYGFKALGLSYLGKFFVNPIKNPIGMFVGVLELLSEFIRVISFTFRLFGNIFAGEVLVLMLTFLMPFVLVDLIYGLELFVGFIQASVFALLVLVFATMATESHGGGHEEHDDDGHEGVHHEGAVQAAH